ncbi:hypothetical protein [Paraburkholderia metrosideri]|jgi:hypothetical protein|uniref:hypothetical protein n=1 Tax=Paraburkholderia metrosideri TaxID=580937 RepID=UPI00191A2B6F|nr:hypothetical protein [Paraburkholderia metrosideri]
MSAPIDERLNTLGEIAHECFGVEQFPCSDQAEIRYVVSVESIARAIESAYDIGLIAGYRLSRATQAR